jgi:membrane fusion protein, heavy metal efflux system
MRLVLAMLVTLFAACSSEQERQEHTPPARVDNAVPESELAIVRLSPEAARRLAIQTARVQDSELHEVRLTSGEVIVPPGGALTVTAPLGGELRVPRGAAPILPGAAVRRGEVLMQLVPFAPVDRDVRARAEREVAASAAQLRAAEARVARLSSGSERAVSRRIHEEAVAARDIVRADLQAAEARARTMRETPLLADVTMQVRAPADGVVRTLSASPGQAVASGAPLLEIVASGTLQVRVAVYAGDLRRIDATQSARVRTLSAAGDSAPESIAVMPVAGPPTAAPERAIIDRYYAVPQGEPLVLGERVLVELPLRSRENARTVPRAAVLYDALGASWVYTCAGDNAFQRARIDPIRTSGDRVVFERGPVLGACVAAQGAVEIFGSEFEPGH